ncbi:uncharacterized protein LOC110203306 isoform X1 [Phascolarctos cinereus]|uniref:Uncharacterized protein LOC110203306 isoform X1 n=1 Tax=Phascolarctos cinereus TaxID=38626 RepID=A0A6P5JQ11_PHACI|nr:uncharacterized protein LOC110203306 isoform X1 [Phascolarctos cinereus]
MAALLGPSALAQLRWGSAFWSIAAGGLGAFAAAFAKLALKPTDVVGPGGKGAGAPLPARHAGLVSYEAFSSLRLDANTLLLSGVSCPSCPAGYLRVLWTRCLPGLPVVWRILCSDVVGQGHHDLLWTGTDAHKLVRQGGAQGKEEPVGADLRAKVPRAVVGPSESQASRRPLSSGGAVLSCCCCFVFFKFLSREETNARHHLIDSCFKDLFRQGVLVSLGLWQVDLCF